MKTIIITTALLSALLSGVALAEENRSCTDVAQANWMSEDAVKSKAKDAGLEVRKIKIEGSCYEVYAIDAKGAKIEALFNPATGEQVGAEGGESN